MGLLTFALQSPTSAIAQVLGEVVKLAENYCVQCHIGNRLKAGLNLSALNSLI